MPATKIKSTWSSGNLIFKESVAANGGQIIFGTTGSGGLDMKLYGTTGSVYALWDESANTLIFEGADIRLNDSDFLKLGDSTDASLAWDGSKIALTAAAASTFQIGSTGTNINPSIKGTLAVLKAVTASSNVSISGDVSVANGKAIQGSSTASESFSLKAYTTGQTDILEVQNSTGNGNYKLGFFAATPTSKAGSIADATTLTNVITACNSIKSALVSLGFIAST